MKNVKYILLTINILTVTIAPAASIEKCQQWAQENYPLIKQYELIKQTTDYSVKNINIGYVPQLSFYAQGTYQSDATSYPSILSNMINADGLKKDQYKIALDVNQIIWDGGNIRTQKKIAKLQGETKNKQIDTDMYAIRNRINNLFFGILLIEEKIKLNKELQSLLLANQQKMETLKQNGIAMQPDIDAIKAEYLKTKQQETDLSFSKQNYAIILSIFTKKDTAELLPLQKPSSDMPSSHENMRPELNLFETQLKQTEYQNKLLNTKALPRISLFAQGFYGYPGLNMFNDMIEHDWSLNGLIGVRINWNISELYTFNNNKQQIVFSKKQIENEKETFLFNNQLLHTQEKSEIKRYKEMMKDDNEIILLRTNIRQAAEAKLTLGIVDINNLLQEILRENQARTDLISHEIEMIKHIYELKYTINQ